MEVAIIDYSMSNLHSVQAACEKEGLSSVITADPGQIMEAETAILPGVGAFGKAMSHLIEKKLDRCIYDFIDSGKPFIGICLGLQLLFDSSEEFGNHKGLGIIKGSVKKIDMADSHLTKYPVPQIGWNRIRQAQIKWENTLLNKNLDNDFVYFVHSYYVQPYDENIILSKTTYGDLEYCSSIQHRNIFACQFHPEKSGEVGLNVYKTLKEGF